MSSDPRLVKELSTLYDIRGTVMVQLGVVDVNDTNPMLVLLAQKIKELEGKL